MLWVLNAIAYMKLLSSCLAIPRLDISTGDFNFKDTEIQLTVSQNIEPRT